MSSKISFARPSLGDEFAELSNRTPLMGFERQAGLIRRCLVARIIYVWAGLVKRQGRLQM